MKRAAWHHFFPGLLLFIALFHTMAAADDLRSLEETAIKAALARVAPSVVRVETVGGLDRVHDVMIGTGPTTGLVVSPDGYIVSSAFNFAQKPDSILVTIGAGSRHAAQLVASDHSRMLVLLKIDPPAPLRVPEIAPIDQMRVGQWALAVGRTFESDRPNVSVGIVSALGRIWGKALQTDAKISPNNYGGPLVDISGRVLGVLTPMSPDGHGEMSGVEWYDSGIGFAVPLAVVMPVLEKLQRGQDLHGGLLGVSLKGHDIFSDPAVLSAVRATGPAYQAGLRPGDQIIEIAGVAIARQAQLKHQLGPLYSGDKVRIVALRGEQRLDREIELVDKIDPYEAPFLGVLPMRPILDDESAGLTVRYALPDSPAAAVGLKPGDRIVAFAGEAVVSVAAVRQRLQAIAPGTKVKLEVRRGDQTLLLEPELGRLPEGLPGELPPAHDVVAAPPGERPRVGLVHLKAPEFPHDCVAYVPENYNPKVPHGVVVWLHAPGGFNDEELVERWKALCDRFEFILLAPKSAEKNRWQPLEASFVRRMLDELMKDYTTDPLRIVVHGHQAGGAMAYVVGFSNAEVFRAIAVAESALPRLAQPLETDPAQPLAIYTTLATKSELTAATQSTITRLRELKYPVAVKPIGEQDRYLTADELTELVRWFDMLDRL